VEKYDNKRSYIFIGLEGSYEGYNWRNKKVLDEKDELREEALKITRKIIRLCGECIRAIHRNELNLAGEKLNKAGKLVEDLGRMLMGHPDLYYAGYVKSAHQEYVEALLFYNYVNDLEFPLPQEVGVPESQYLLGLGDFIGELRRYFLENLVKGDLEGAEKVCRSIKDNNNSFSSGILGYPGMNLPHHTCFHITDL